MSNLDVDRLVCAAILGAPSNPFLASCANPHKDAAQKPNLW